MRGDEFFGRAEKDSLEPARLCVADESLQKPLRNPVLRAAPLSGDEHLAKGAAAEAEIEKANRADDPAGLRCRDPKSALAPAVEGGDVLEVRLVVNGDRKAELFALDRKDEFGDARPVVGPVCAEFDQPWRALNRGFVLLMT
jgi:hypothetical protein